MVRKKKIFPKSNIEFCSDEDIVYAFMKIKGKHEVLTRTKSVTTGGLSRETAR